MISKLKKIGRHGRINIKANRILKEKFSELGIFWCEPKLDGCLRTFGLSFAHKHKRNWYYSQQELLWSINEVVIACASCHIRMEADKELTEEVFNRLRK